MAPPSESKKSRVTLDVTSFQLPPYGDVLVLGRDSQIGPEAAKRMLDYAAPNQFEMQRIENDEVIEAMLFKRHLTLRMDKDKLVRLLLEEVKPVMSSTCMLTVRCDIVLTIMREV